MIKVIGNLSLEMTKDVNKPLTTNVAIQSLGCSKSWLKVGHVSTMGAHPTFTPFCEEYAPLGSVAIAAYKRIKEDEDMKQAIASALRKGDCKGWLDLAGEDYAEK